MCVVMFQGIQPQSVLDWLHNRPSYSPKSIKYHGNEHPIKHRFVLEYYKINLEIQC